MVAPDAILAPFWSSLGLPLDPLGALLGAFMALVGSPWGSLGPFWEPFWPFWAPLGPSGSLFGPCWFPLGAFRVISAFYNQFELIWTVFGNPSFDLGNFLD